ncbi:MAG: ATP synthase F1 subunit delta, partial [Anaerolineae bacterium]
VSFARKESLLKKVLPARLPAEAANFVRVLVRDNRVASLSGIIRELETLGRWGPGVGIVNVTSAAPLTKGEVSALKGKVSDRWGERLDFRFHVDPALLGGVVVRLDDKVIDGSVEGRLRALHRHLAGQA